MNAAACRLPIVKQVTRLGASEDSTPPTTEREAGRPREFRSFHGMQQNPLEMRRSEPSGEPFPCVHVCALTSDPTDAALFRVALSPSPENGRHEDCRLMVDKITTVRRERLSRRIGSLSVSDMRRIDQAILVFLGIAR